MIQDRLIRVIPVYNFKKYFTYLKDFSKEFNRAREIYESIVKDMKARGLNYLLDLLVNK